MDHSLCLMVSPRVDTLRVSEAGNQLVIVHERCTWGWRVNLRVLDKRGGWDKATSSHGVSVRRVIHILLFYGWTQRGPHDIDYIGDKVFELPLNSGLPWTVTIDCRTRQRPWSCLSTSTDCPVPLNHPHGRRQQATTYLVAGFMAEVGTERAKRWKVIPQVEMRFAE